MSDERPRPDEVYESFVCRCGTDEQAAHKHATIEQERQRAARLLGVKTRRVTDTHMARIMAISERSGCRALRAFGRHVGCPHESKASA